MLNKKRLLLLVVAGLAMALAAAPLALAAGRGVSKDTIKIGLVMVKTGPVAILGLSQGQGTADYFRYINEQGGVNGRKIKLIWEDDQFQAPKSVAAVKKLITRDQVLTIVSTGGTAQTIANLRNIKRYKISNVPNGLSEEFFRPYNPYIFPMGAIYREQFYTIVDYIKYDLKLKKPRVGIVFAKAEFGKKGAKAVQDRCKQYGIPVVASLALPVNAVDASSQVLALKKAKANIVVTSSLIPRVILFLKTAQKFKYAPKVFGFNWATDDIVVRAAGEAARNYIGINFIGGWWDKSPGVLLARKLAKKYNSKPKLTNLYLGGVGVAMLYVEAFKRAGKDLNPDSLKAAFESFRNLETGGLFPPVTYTAKSHAPSKMVKFFKADLAKKRLVPITGWRQPR